MGVASPADAAAARGRAPHLFEQVNEGLQDKGFVVTQLESLVNWARAGEEERSREARRRGAQARAGAAGQGRAAVIFWGIIAG